MGWYFHKSLDDRGRFVHGVGWSPSRFAALKKLSGRRVVVRFREFSPFQWLKRCFLRKRPVSVSSEQILGFTQRMDVLIQSGLDVAKALKILHRQQKNRGLKEIIYRIWDGLHKGYPLYEMLKCHSAYFDHFYVYTVECAEKGGYLSSVFGRLAETLAFRLKLKKEFRSNMAYPLVVFFLGAIIFSLLLFFVVPHFEHFLIHQISDEPVSMATQCVFKLSAFFRHYGVFLWGLFLAGILWPKSSRFWSRFGALPLLNRFTNALCLGQISGHVATMLKNDVPLLDALTVGSHLSCRYEESIRTVVRRLSNGQPLSFALEGNILFPHLMIEMVRLGEENGRMDEAFSKVSSHYLLEYQKIMFLIVRWSEPALIIFLAFLLGFLFFSIFSPILHCLVRM